AVPDDRALAVRTAKGVTYLVWRGQRLLLGATALGALGFTSVPPLEIEATWLNSLSRGPALVAQPPGDVGRPRPPVGGQPTAVGQVLQAQGPAGQVQSFLVRADGLTPVTATEAALLLADPRLARAYPDTVPRAIDVKANQVAQAPRSATAPAQLPAD